MTATGSSPGSRATSAAMRSRATRRSWPTPRARRSAGRCSFRAGKSVGSKTCGSSLRGSEGGSGLSCSSASRRVHASSARVGSSGRQSRTRPDSTSGWAGGTSATARRTRGVAHCRSWAATSASDEFRRSQASLSSTTKEADMSKVVVTEFITLDGVIEDPGGSEKTELGGWAFQFERGDEGERFKLDELTASDAQLLGRVTYDGFAAAWPAMEETTGDFGKKMNAMPKYVVSKTLQSAEWNNTTVLRGDLADEVAPLKEQYAGDILVAGSAQLVQSLLTAGLVDELHLMVFPVFLGRGKRLFADETGSQRFTLADVRQTAEVAILTLRREGG